MIRHDRHDAVNGASHERGTVRSPAPAPALWAMDACRAIEGEGRAGLPSPLPPQFTPGLYPLG
jgi:hypothetical protein